MVDSRTPPASRSPSVKHRASACVLLVVAALAVGCAPRLTPQQAIRDARAAVATAEQERGPDGVRHTRFAVIRNTYRELEDTTRKTFEKWIRPEMGTCDESEFAFRIKLSAPSPRARPW